MSELGVGMWGMGGGTGDWTGADDRQSMAVLQAAVDAGVTFVESTLVYGFGHTDRLLGELLRSNPGRELFVASKVPPKNHQWPANPGDRIRDVFPPDHVRVSVRGMLRQMKAESLDLVQFPVWQDAWADDEGWQRAVEEIRSQGLARHVGISVNRREPRTCSGPCGPAWSTPPRSSTTSSTNPRKAPPGRRPRPAPRGERWGQPQSASIER